ncbi:MAG: TPR Domain containing protein, partial [uncultured bacterium]
AFASLVFFFPDITKSVWYLRIAYLETPVEKLSNIGGDHAVYVAEKLLNSHNNLLVDKGLTLSEKLNSAYLIPYIIPFIKSENRSISEKALKSISSISADEVLTALGRIAANADAQVRLGILQAISSIKGNKKVPEILGKFVNDDKWVIRLVLAEELNFHKSPESIAVLKKLLQDDYLDVALTASMTLSNIGEDNIYKDIFSHLQPETSWLDKVRAIRLISLFPEKMVGLLIARYITSPIKFLAVSALEWMIAKGDKRDFSFVVTETDSMPPGVVKAFSVKALAYLAETASKKDQVILTLSRFLNSPNEELIAASLEGLRILKGTIAKDDVKRIIKSSNIELAKEAVLTLGAFNQDEDLKIFMELSSSPHSKLREAAYTALLNYPKLLQSNVFSEIKQCETIDEIEALALFLFFHAGEDIAKNILMNQYKSCSVVEFKIKYIEVLSALVPSITSLELLKLLDKTDLAAWEKAKKIMDRCSMRLKTPGLAEGFYFYKTRQPKRSSYSVMSFTSASESFWDHKDILYLKGSGMVEGIVLSEDYNSYYYANNENEVLQIEKNLVVQTYFSPLYELWRLYKKQVFYKEIFDLSIKQHKWNVAAYVIQKCFSKINILKSEILYQPIAVKSILYLEDIWKKNAEEFKAVLKANNLQEMGDKYVEFNEAFALEIEKLSPEEAAKKQGLAEELYKEGAIYGDSGDYEKAIAKYNEALNTWPFHAETIKAIGLVYAKQGKYEDALKFYEKLKAKRPNDLNVLNSLSLVYRLKGDNKAALDVLTSEIEIDPSKARPRLDASDVLSELGRGEDAVAILESGLNTVIDKFDIYFKLAKIYRKEKNIESAIKYIQSCLEIQPENIEVLTYMGLVLFSQGNLKEAVSYLKKAIAFDLANVPARLTLAEIYISNGEMKEATEELKKILVIDPINKDAKALLESMEK